MLHILNMVSVLGISWGDTPRTTALKMMCVKQLATVPNLRCKSHIYIAQYTNISLKGETKLFLQWHGSRNSAAEKYRWTMGYTGWKSWRKDTETGHGWELNWRHDWALHWCGLGHHTKLMLVYWVESTT